MNQLWVRLALAFVFLSLVGVTAVAWLADKSVGAEFRQYLSRQEMLTHGSLLPELAGYYDRRGSWDGVALVMPTLIAPSRPASGMPASHPTLLLADARGAILYDEREARRDENLTAEERWNALTILQGERIVGFIYATPPGRDDATPAALEFLNEFQNTLAIAVIAVGGLGIAMALVISRTMVAPLINLAAAARALGARQWDRRVAVRGAVEIASVARAFNEMADELQRSEDQQKSIMADIAHELRTPLTVLQGNLRAMLDHVYAVDDGEIAKLYDQTRLLSRLVDDLYELAQAESRHLSLKLDTVDLARTLDDVAGELATVAEAREVQLNVRACEELPTVCADPDRVRQVLLNLLSNALRHSSAGGQVDVCSERLTTADSGDRVRITVSDQGEGIPPADLPHVFERFYRVDKSRSRESGGIGLGLAIAQAWVHAMDGEIGAESAPGRGSSFWFTLPVACVGKAD